MITKNKSLVPSIFPDFPVDVITGSALDVFEDFFDNMLGNRQRAKDLFRNKIEYPKTDIYIDEGNLVFEMSVPGLSKDDLEITFEDNSITIKGKKKECAEDKGVKYYQKELKHSSFVRSWTLPASELDLKNKEIESNLSNGILSIKVPIKKEEKPERLKIPIK